MFGQRSDQADNTADDQAAASNPPMDDGAAPPMTDDQSSAPASEPSFDPSNNDQNDTPSDNSAWQHPGDPLENTSTNTAAPISDVISPGGDFPQSPNLPAVNSFGSANGNTAGAVPMPAATNDDASSDDSPASDLTGIKQQALEQLAPLVDDLDQSAEDRFRTLMMMIQASDDQSLIPKAYEAAQKIEDENAKAKALLDVVNEINYFNQPHDANSGN